MKKEKKEKTKQPYSYFSNLRFICAAQWKFRKSYLFAAAAAAPMASVSSVLAAFLPKVVLDCIERHVSPAELLWRVGVLSLCAVLLVAAENLLNTYCDTSMIIAADSFWRMQITDKIMDMDYHIFTRKGTRSKREKAMNSLMRSGPDGFIRINIHLFSALFGFSAFTTIIVRCSFWFIPALIAGYALSMLGWKALQKFRDKLKDEEARIRLRMDYISQRSKDFAEAKDIRVYEMQPMLDRKAEQALEKRVSLLHRIHTGHMLNTLLEDVLTLAVTIGAYAYLIHLKLHTDMTLGDFALYLGAITGFGSWLTRLADAFSESLECAHSVGDYRSFLDIPDERKRTGEALPTGDALPCAIEFDHVTFAYEDAEKPTIRDFSLTIRPGEHVAIVGDNGAGKTTLVKLLCGLLAPDSGHIRVGGRDVQAYGRDDYFTLFATVLQTVNFLPATVAKNVALCPEEEIDRDRLWDCFRKANIDEKIASLPNKENTLMVKDIHEGATAFSGGEQQRLLLARALYKDAPILVLDEPTAALDPIAENDLYMQYNTFAADKTSIYISHRLSSTRFCDRVVLLADGTAAEVGSHDELMRAGGAYAELFRLQSRYYEKEANAQ
ncbi:MAG: ABC transporter ATP-binding protein [Clostridia bacterium]|nr:ABC transporter ATP-binding protein [Clostridia bacterium]